MSGQQKPAGIRLRRGKPPFLPVPLGNGAFIRLRAATSMEIDAASVEVGQQIAAIALGSAHAARLAELLPDFDPGALADFAGREVDERRALLRDLGFRTNVDVLTRRLLLIALVERCHDGWSGVHDADGIAIPTPSAGTIAALLLDSRIREDCEQAIFARLHLEHAEGNASPASPNGGAGEEQKPAPSAGPAASPAPKAPSTPPVAAVRK